MWHILTVDDQTVGERGLGEYARSQIEGARRDRRLDRDDSAPFADFEDALDEVIRARVVARMGAESLARTELGMLDLGEEQQAWERRELGRAEIAGDFGWLNSSTLISLHGALDALVEAVGPVADRVVAPFAARELVHEALTRKGNEVAMVSEDHIEAVVEAAADAIRDNRKYKKPRSNGPERWESVLRDVGLGLRSDQSVPRDLRRVLTEACVLRDVLVHRGGRVDEKALRECAHLGYAVGEFVRLSSSRTRELAAAIIAYGMNVSHRAAARFGAGDEPSLDDGWRRFGPML
jgi:hypothetical protein